MAETREGLFSLNAGEVSKTALAHVDLAKLKIAAERQENLLPLVLGPTMLRPGTQFIARGGGDLPGFFFEFKKDETFAAVLLATSNGFMQILDSATDTFVSRPAVTAQTVNGFFDATGTGWINSSEPGASIIVAGDGFLRLIGTGQNYGWADQQVGVAEPGVEHGVRLLISRGDVVVKIGTSQGAGDYWDVELAEGVYSLALQPSGNFWIRLGSRRAWTSFVDFAVIDLAGALTLPHPWAGRFDQIQYDRSEDVLFVACEGLQQRRIERRNTLDMRSWGIALYRVDDGPFMPANLGSTSLTPNTLSGTITLTANRALFSQGHIGALFRLTSAGQTQTAILGGPDQFTGNIRVSGLSPERLFFVTLSGITASGVTLQRSFTDPGAWTDVTVYVTNGTVTYNDMLDNQIYWYRLIVKSSGYATGDVINATLEHAGSQTGIVRIRDVPSSTIANADVLVGLGQVAATTDWAEGEWSDKRGWPIAVALHDGRLFWQCALRIQGSISDAFHSFDDAQIGDAAPINRTTVNSKPHWMISALRLMIGSTLQEISVRASAFDEPLTPTAFAPRACSDRGSTQLRAVAVDSRVVFVGRDKRRVFLLQYDAAKSDFVATEVTRLKQEMCASTVVDIAVQRQPDTRLYLVLGNGSIAVLVHEPAEEVSAWVPYTFGGDLVERVACLPGIEEDKVYIYVNRGGKRCIERFAMRTEAQGGVLNKTMDSHVVVTGTGLTTVVTGLDHIEGRQVVVWADSHARVIQDAPLTVSGGSVTLPQAQYDIVVGLPYDGFLQTAKLAYGAKNGTSLSASKRVGPIGLVMTDVSWQGVRIGRDFDHMTYLPSTYRGRPLSPGEVLDEWDDIPSAWNGGWGADPRICVKVRSPHCATLMGIALGEQVNEGEDVPAAPRQR